VPYPRKSLISLDDTPYYHVVARCVRRAWLWGFDQYAGKDYSHRKAWVLERLEHLRRMFAIDICAYAIMSNHYHLVLHVDRARARAWTDEDVIEHWALDCRSPLVVERYRRGEGTEAESTRARQIIQNWRARLHDISWFMRMLNEQLARRANAEDGCTGRFWEGRFKSQALLDESGLLTAMAYVDLNPVRAGIAEAPESSEYTSIYERIRALRTAETSGATSTHDCAPIRLMPFGDHSGDSPRIPFALTDYLTLVDTTGRIVRAGKRGVIESLLPPILERLNIDPGAWEDLMFARQNFFGRALGRLDHLRLHAKLLQQSWIRNQRRCAQIFG
jgi:REP element-mobilizing transposase RayT